MVSVFQAQPDPVEYDHALLVSIPPGSSKVADQQAHLALHRRLALSFDPVVLHWLPSGISSLSCRVQSPTLVCQVPLLSAIRRH
jgi:hypothetical protein